MDPFQVLDLPSDAPKSAVKERYRDLAKKYHPDMPDGSPEKFRAVSEAYHSIIDGGAGSVTENGFPRGSAGFYSTAGEDLGSTQRGKFYSFSQNMQANPFKKSTGQKEFGQSFESYDAYSSSAESMDAKEPFLNRVMFWRRPKTAYETLCPPTLRAKRVRMSICGVCFGQVLVYVYLEYRRQLYRSNTL